MIWTPVVWQAKWNESSTLIPKIDSLLQQSWMTYDNITHIVVLRWPGSFTGVRTSVLVANTLAYSLWIKITPLSFFDMFAGYPIIKASSRRDCFVQKSATSEIEIIANDTLINYLNEQGISELYGEKVSFLDEHISVFDKIDYQSILSDISFATHDRVEPFYIKRPNIS